MTRFEIILQVNENVTEIFQPTSVLEIFYSIVTNLANNSVDSFIIDFLGRFSLEIFDQQVLTCIIRCWSPWYFYRKHDLIADNFKYISYHFYHCASCLSFPLCKAQAHEPPLGYRNLHSLHFSSLACWPRCLARSATWRLTNVFGAALETGESAHRDSLQTRKKLQHYYLRTKIKFLHL